MAVEVKVATLKATEMKILSFVPKNKAGLADMRLVPIAHEIHTSN
jgi:hypothetical protein